eukprot:CAMPEP_0183597090 /NCGR_PEP_ID=MMETSP0371-20130417/176294_1 /TAXON_ID=268820 /ORGANISM="Peridinium aciculiferum, Strain PAER-2" /LENGTH=324 /DNA_ID=CAMNT_0025809017 /DNA_START=33 /DNA_END=1004 /DNA_ORIENTATION=-
MKHRGFELDLLSYTSALNACAQNQEWVQTLDLLGSIRDDVVRPDAIIHQIVLTACQRARQHEAEALVMLEMRDFELGVAVAYHPWLEALLVLRRMSEQGVTPSIRLFNTTIQACGDVEAWQHALALFPALRACRVEADGSTFAALGVACGRGRQWAQAMAVLDDMRLSGLPLDVPTVNASIRAFAKAEQWVRALALFDELQGVHTWRPDAASYSAAMRAWTIGQQWQQALHLLDGLLDSRRDSPDKAVVPEPIGFARVALACSEAGVPALVRAVFRALASTSSEIDIDDDSDGDAAAVAAAARIAHTAAAVAPFLVACEQSVLA